jgi:peptide methionine sulfoxide reductase msrA/msrB
MKHFLLVILILIGTGAWIMSANNDHKIETATFAGGCFWCTEFDFDTKDGVISAVSGYAGGNAANATYAEVSRGRTQHREAVQIKYNPSKITYKELLDLYWRGIDPTDSGGQFVDRGAQYTAAIYFHSASQEDAAIRSKENLAASGKHESPIVTPIVAFTTFFPAEDYHQDYYKKDPIRYKQYRRNSGRPIH